MSTLETYTLNTPQTPGADKDMHKQIAYYVLKQNFHGPVSYRQGLYTKGKGHCRNMGYGEIKIKANDSLVKGEPIELKLDCFKFRGEPVTLAGTVANMVQAGPGEFIALVRVKIPGTEEFNAA